MEKLALLAGLIFCYRIFMVQSISDNGKSRGRPETGIGKPVGLRLYPDLEKALDAYAADQADTPGRPEAIRRLLKDGLERLGYLASLP